MSEKRIVIAGGGTGGHIFPAIAIADAIKAIEPNAQIHFMGALGRMEMERVPKAGYPITGLWISGIQRKLTIRNLLFPIKLLHSLFTALSFLKKYKPGLVVGVGGYASGPAMRAAAFLKIPILIQEQNSYAGITNKWVAKKATAICVAYSGMEKFFPQEKITLTGNPVRGNLEQVANRKDLGCTHWGFDPDPVVLITGGSLGARTLNAAMANTIELLLANQIKVIWQTGKFYFDQYKPLADKYNGPNAVIVPFIERMDMAYAAADVVVARAGALTVSELCVVGKPSVLIPSPNVAEDHQTKNAQAMANVGAAILVTDQNAPKTLPDTLLALFADKNKLESLAKNAKSLAKPNAAQNIAQIALNIYKN